MTMCECCDLDEASCGKAAEAKLVEAVAKFRDGLVRCGWIRAEYPGHCVRCGDPFKPGVCIKSARAPTGGVGWIAECCAVTR